MTAAVEVMFFLSHAGLPEPPTRSILPDGDTRTKQEQNKNEAGTHASSAGIFRHHNNEASEASLFLLGF